MGVSSMKNIGMKKTPTETADCARAGMGKVVLMEAKHSPEQTVEESINELVDKAARAGKKLLEYTQERIDAIVKAMALAGVDRHMELARLAYEETGKGVYEDKITKNLFATEYVYHDIKNEKTVGVIEENEEEGYM
jgi:acetaldehyde dehydrogenase/alcohol dehydrogenase